MKQKLSILIVGLLFALVSCTSRNPKLFLGDGECYPPCWYGLTPNRTMLSEAPDILKSLPIINGQSVKSISFTNPPEIDVGWDFTGDTIGYGYLYFDASSMLERIKIVPKGLNLGDIIDTWGNPTSVLAHYRRDPGGQYYFLWMFYPERGIGVQAIGLDVHNEPGSGNEDVIRDMDVDEISLYAPSRGIEYYIAKSVASWQETAQSYIKRLLPWPGFGKDVIHVEK